MLINVFQAVIVDVESRKALYADTRNSYCVLHARYLKKGKKPPPHDCGMNWNKSATEMESDIILQGFLTSRDTAGLTYNLFTGESFTSSMFLRLSLSVQQNHVDKNSEF